MSVSNQSYIDIDQIQTFQALATAVGLNQIENSAAVPACIQSQSFQSTHTSFWQRFHIFENREEQGRLAGCVKNIFKQSVFAQFQSPEKQAVIERHWETILSQACSNLGESSSDDAIFLESQKVKKLFLELQTVIADIAPVGFLADDVQMIEEEPIKNFVKYILHDIAVNGHILNCHTITKVIQGLSSEDLGKLRQEFKNVVEQLCNLSQQKPGEKSLILEMFLGNLLALYALTDPVSGEELRIPQWQTDKWEIATYRTRILPLTPLWMGQESEAIALEPTIASPNTASLLLFKGTAIPGAKGYACTLLADFTPFQSVGEILYRLGKSQIDTWLQSVHRQDGPKVKVYGLSLGGSMCYHAGMDHPNEMEIHAYVPAGLLQTHPLQDTLEGQIFFCQQDIVSTLGYHPEGPQMYKVLSKAPRDPFSAHVRAFGGEETVVLRVNTVWENSRRVRQLLTLLHQIFAIPFFITCALYMILKFAVIETYRLFARCIYSAGEPVLQPSPSLA